MVSKQICEQYGWPKTKRNPDGSTSNCEYYINQTVSTFPLSGDRRFGEFTGVANVYQTKPLNTRCLLTSETPDVYAHVMVVDKDLMPSEDYSHKVTKTDHDTLETEETVYIEVQERIKIALPELLFWSLSSPSCSIKGYDKWKNFLETCETRLLSEIEMTPEKKNAIHKRITHEKTRVGPNPRLIMNKNLTFWRWTMHEKSVKGNQPISYDQVNARTIGFWFTYFKLPNEDKVDETKFVVTDFFPLAYLPQPHFNCLGGDRRKVQKPSKHDEED